MHAVGPLAMWSLASSELESFSLSRPLVSQSGIPWGSECQKAHWGALGTSRKQAFL